jgi:hypothetical protein
MILLILLKSYALTSTLYLWRSSEYKSELIRVIIIKFACVCVQIRITWRFRTADAAAHREVHKSRTYVHYYFMFDKEYREGIYYYIIYYKYIGKNLTTPMRIKSKYHYVGDRGICELNDVMMLYTHIYIYCMCTYIFIVRQRSKRNTYNNNMITL